MVLINGVKYACERCIRGHRVTTCSHTDHPMVMVKPKGRPSTTCEYCKKLRRRKYANLVGICTCKRQGKLKQQQLQREKEKEKIATATTTTSASGKGRAREKLKGSTILDIGRKPRTRVTKKKAVATENGGSSSNDYVGNPNVSSNNNNSNGTGLLTPQTDQLPTFKDPVPLSPPSAANFIVAAGPPSVVPPSVELRNSLATNFIDGNLAAGQYSGDYKEMYPMAVQYGSRGSIPSSNQYFSAPQSPSSFSTPGNFLSTIDPYNGIMSPQDSMAINENDFGGYMNIGRTWSLDMSNSIDNSIAHGGLTRPPMDHFQRSFSVGYNAGPRNSVGLGEVIVPLEEYIPTNVDGVGKVTDKGPELDDWILKIDPIAGNNIPSPPAVKNEGENLGRNLEGIPDPIKGHGLLDALWDPASMRTITRANSLLHDQKDDNSSSGSGGNSIIDTNVVSAPMTTKKNTGTNLPASGAPSNPSPVQVLTVTPSFTDILDDRGPMKPISRSGASYSNGKLPSYQSEKPKSTYTMNEPDWKNGSLEQPSSPFSAPNLDVNTDSTTNAGLPNDTDLRMSTGTCGISASDLVPPNPQAEPCSFKGTVTPASTSTTAVSYTEQLPPSTNVSVDVAINPAIDTSSYKQVPLLPGQNFADLDSLLSAL